MEYLNYHHLRYFWAVAKEGGLTKAAAKLNVSQPTISAQAQTLEGVLGERSARPAADVQQRPASLTRKVVPGQRGAPAISRRV
jgi:hypothetical protein